MNAQPQKLSGVPCLGSGTAVNVASVNNRTPDA
jgi:hypothetical protein